MYTYPIYIKLACMIRMITLILPWCCLFNPERHELARGIYIIREVCIAMFVIRIIQLTIAFNHSYHTCKFDIDWISILLKISKINANFDIAYFAQHHQNYAIRQTMTLSFYMYYILIIMIAFYHSFIKVNKYFYFTI